MEELNIAYKTVDGKIFKDREEAELHEHSINREKEIRRLVERWYGYNGITNEINFVVENILKYSDELHTALS